MILDRAGTRRYQCDRNGCDQFVPVPIGESLPGKWSLSGPHMCVECSVGGFVFEAPPVVVMLELDPAPRRYHGPAVVYLAHPLGGDVEGNAARARRWLRWLMDSEPDVAFCCPWLPYVDVGDDDSPTVRARGLRDDVAIAQRCDGIVLCGGRVSSGMQLELDAVVAAGGWVADLTFLGAEPGAPCGTLLNAGRIVWRGR